MREDGSKARVPLHRQFRQSAGAGGNSSPRMYSLEMISRLRSQRPELRLEQDPMAKLLIDILSVDPNNLDAQERLAALIDQKQAEYLASGDVFWGNYPTPGSTTYPNDFIGVARMPTGEPAGFCLSQTPCSIVVPGMTGSGKTSLIKTILLSPTLLRDTRVIAFVRKRELRHLASLANIAHLVLTFELNDLRLSFCQPPPGVSDQAWCTESARFLAQSYGIFTAHRLMTDAAAKLLEHHPENVYPTLRQLLEFLEQHKPRDHFRDAQYKTSIVTCLTDLLNCTGTIWDYSASDFLKVLFTTPGLAIIEATALGQQHLTFLATYMARWLFMWRVHND